MTERIIVFLLKQVGQQVKFSCSLEIVAPVIETVGENWMRALVLGRWDKSLEGFAISSRAPHPTHLHLRGYLQTEKKTLTYISVFVTRYICKPLFYLTPLLPCQVTGTIMQL